MKIKTLALEKIRPYERNPRKNDGAVDAVAESIRQCGYCAPIVIDEAGVILAGHTRYKALQKLGWEKVQVCQVEGLSEEQKRKYRILDNKTGEIAEWDDDLLEIELDGLDFEGFDFGLLEQEAGEDQAAAEITEDDFDEEPPEEPTAKRGQVWQLGRHRLMCGDATSLNDVQTCMGGRQANVAVTDPPYGIQIVSGGAVGGSKPATFKGKVGAAASVVCEVNLYPPVIGDDSTDAAKQAFEILRTEAKEQILFGGNYFSDFLPPSPCWIVWDKQTGENNFADCELAWTSFKKHARLYTWMWNGMARAGERKSEGKNRIHPTQKPVGLFAEIISDFSEDGDIILDPFGGSGTTLIACEQTGRSCRMLEIDPHYCDVIIRRWEEFTGEKAVLLDE